MQPPSATDVAPLYTLESILQRIDLSCLFPACQPLEIELGSGDGSFLAQYAAQSRDRNFIGVERLLGRVRKLDRKARQAGLGNLRVIRIESSYFLEHLLPPASAAVLHVYFPDPWPKRRHWRHRVVNERFPELAKQALAPGGTVYLRTDDKEYFRAMTAIFGSAKHFRAVETPEKLASVLTDFEREFHARSVATWRAAYRLQP